ncbi:MAG: adenylosuccinate synthase [Nitrososphaerota archaeon]|nr:adenylosuccinate synthase [Candidatus Geocrenenecus dongiae]
MSGIVVLGLQWGDEGKGKVSYILSRDADYVVRFQGGANAGHTVVLDDGRELRFNMLPAGSAAGAVPCIASGTVVDLDELEEEVNLLRSIGVYRNLLISKCANIVLPIHKSLDRALEEARGKRSVGTTGRGIGPAYSDKALRIGLRVEDVLDPEALSSRLEVLRSIHKVYGDVEGYILQKSSILRESVCDLELILNDVIDGGGKIVFEGAQGTLLDIDHGTYPYVTSSNTTIGAVSTSCGVSLRKISEIVGVMKAYTTRVGEGVFPTELKDQIGERLREVGGEYGTTTGRPRRVGWLDIPLLRYAVKINDVDWIALTKIDVLSGLDKIKICVEYEVEGSRIVLAPPRVSLLEKAKPVLIEVDGWTKLSRDEWRKISEKGVDALPENAIRYIEIVEELLGKPIKLISCGAEAGLVVWRT